MVLLPTPEAPEIIVASPRSGTVVRPPKPPQLTSCSSAARHCTVSSAGVATTCGSKSPSTPPTCSISSIGHRSLLPWSSSVPALASSRRRRRRARRPSGSGRPRCRWRAAAPRAAPAAAPAGSSGSTASLISKRSSVGGADQQPGLHDARDRVARPLLVAGLVGGVRRPEARDVLDEVLAVDVDPRVAARLPGAQPVAQVDEHERLLARPGGVVEQGREAAAGLRTRLPLPRDLALAVDLRGRGTGR